MVQWAAMKRPTIAYCSPVNPAPSGISDYSEELLPYLGQYAEVIVYVADGLKPSNSQLAEHLEVRPLRKLARDSRRRRYQGILYHMGNSPAHAEIWRAAQQTPGVIVLHDLVLHHFMLWYAANVEHRIQNYVKLMEHQYGEAGGHMAQLMIRSRFSASAFDYPCNETVVQVAAGVVAHSAYITQRVAAMRPGLPVANIPMGVPLPPETPSSVARARLGLDSSHIYLASFGHINAYKRLESALRTLAALRAEGREAHYLLVGSVSPNFDLTSLIRRMNLAEYVHVTGYVPRDQFEDYVAAADLCLNLRHPTAGETSASLLRLLGAGKPTLVTATGSFAELPAGIVAQVDPDASEEALLLAYCRALLDQPALAAALGQAARSYVAREHTLEASAAHYAGFLAHLYNWPMVQRWQASPLWQPNPPAETPAVPAPPAQITPPAAAPLVQASAQALAELGVGERDQRLLAQVAERLSELS